MSLSIADLEKYGQIIDYHIRSLTEMTECMRDMKQSIDELRLAQETQYHLELNRLRQDFESLVQQLDTLGISKIDTYESQFNVIKNKLVTSDWPAALDPNLINYDPQEKAEYILDMLILENIENTRFLDYGSENDFLINEALKRGAKAALAVNEPPTQGDYDIILLYDVLDHVQNPEEILHKLKNVLAEGGRIYVRCHPWCSRHGGHYHEKINKAFIHLILDDLELTRLGYSTKKYLNKITHPLQTYQKWFADTGFKILQEIPIETEVESYFLYDHALFDRLKQIWPDDNIKSYLSLQFVDYILQNADSGQKIF